VNKRCSFALIQYRSATSSDHYSDSFSRHFYPVYHMHDTLAGDSVQAVNPGFRLS